MKLKIAILDSGIDNTCPALNGISYSGIHFFINSSSDICMDNNLEDEIGHGTAVTFEIFEKTKNIDVEFFIVKIFNQSLEIDEEVILTALEYLLKNYSIQLINISAGVTRCIQKKRFQNICQSLLDNHCIIISAFDNNGAMSYPAVLNSVIGVDINLHCKSSDQFIYVENSVVNILAFGMRQRLPWLNHNYIEVSGASFAAPYVTAFIANKLYEKSINLSLENILLEFKNISIKQFIYPLAIPLEKPFNPISVLLFPWNKEQYNLLRYESQLNFNISHIADCRMLGKIGNILYNFSDIKERPEMVIENIEKVNWNNSFDTVILGHTKLINSLTNKDWISYIIDNCIKFHKNLYAYDDLSDYKIQLDIMLQNSLMVYYPHITKNMVTTSNFNKLYQSANPVLAIVGTSPKQGKFSLQQIISKNLKQVNYKVGMLCSEPNGFLFGADEILPFGYEASIDLNQREFILLVNQMIHNIELTIDPDIIIVGSQSQSIPYSTGNIGFYPIEQHSLLLAAEPNAIILCVNPNDELEYIERTLSYLNSIIYSKTIALSLFPFYNKTPEAILTNKFSPLKLEEIENKKNILSKTFNLPTLSPIHNPMDGKLMTDIILDFFK